MHFGRYFFLIIIMSSQLVSKKPFKCQAQSRTKSDLPWLNGHHGTKHQQIFWWDFSFNETFWPELASPWGGHNSKMLKVETPRRGLSFSAFLSHSRSVNCKEYCATVSHAEKSYLVQTQVRLDFQGFQPTVWIRAWRLIHCQEQVELKQAKSCSALESL